MLLHTNVVLSSCAAVATDQHGRVTEGGCLRVNKKGAGGLAGGLKYKRKRLSKAETKAFRALWVKTGLVTIDESDGPSPTRKLNLGPIIVMGRPH